jgi:hypothetical protein
MRFREIIAEKRRNASVNKKESGLSQLLKYKGQADVFVSFTSDVGTASNPTEITPHDTQTGVRARGGNHNARGSKIGINPQTEFDTPVGIYAYPVDYVIEKQTRMEFAASRPYMYVFRAQGNVLDLRSYTDADLKQDVAKLMKLYDFSESEVKRAMRDATTQTPGGQIWNITRMVSIAVTKREEARKGFDNYDEYEPQEDDFDSFEEYEAEYMDWEQNKPKSKVKTKGDAGEETAAPMKWNTVWRALGYSAVIDLDGLGIIHENEATQGVFFSIKSIKALEVIDSIDPQPEWKLTRVWADKPELFISQMQKGKIALEDIIEFMKEHEYMFSHVPFDAFPNDFKKYIFAHPLEFLKRSYAMHHVPFPPATQIMIIDHDPRQVQALHKPLARPVLAYIAKNFSRFAKEVPEVIDRLPPAQQVAEITKNPALITYLPGSPTMVAAPVLAAIIDIDPSLFMRYYHSYDAPKIHPSVIAKFYKQVVVPRKHQTLEFLSLIASKYPAATLGACLAVTDKRTARAFYKLASGPMDGNLVQKDWTRNTSKPPSMLAKLILKYRPDLA